MPHTLYEAIGLTQMLHFVGTKEIASQCSLQRFPPRKPLGYLSCFGYFYNVTLVFMIWGKCSKVKLKTNKQ